MSKTATDFLRRLTGMFMNKRTRQALILMYHRVAEVPMDPWDLCVSPPHFAEHLEVLQRRGTCLPLNDLVEGLRNERFPSEAIVVTFDDGYADNLKTAKPLLEEYGIPATVFLTTGYLENKHEFWWDELERLLLQPGELPARLQLKIGGERHEWSLNHSASYSAQTFDQHRHWRAWDEAPNKRHELYISLWEALYKLPHDSQQHVLSQLRSWAGVGESVRSTHRTLSCEEVISLCDDGLIDVGAHTITHPPLALQPPNQQQSEIEQSKYQLERLLGHPIRSFSYPHGDFSAKTVSLVRAAGFSCACSTAAVPVEPGTDRFQLPRVQVLDWDGPTFDSQLTAWLSGNKQNWQS